MRAGVPTSTPLPEPDAAGRRHAAHAAVARGEVPPPGRPRLLPCRRLLRALLRGRRGGISPPGLDPDLTEQRRSRSRSPGRCARQGAGRLPGPARGPRTARGDLRAGGGSGGGQGHRPARGRGDRHAGHGPPRVAPDRAEKQLPDRCLSRAGWLGPRRARPVHRRAGPPAGSGRRAGRRARSPGAHGAPASQVAGRRYTAGAGWRRQRRAGADLS